MPETRLTTRSTFRFVVSEVVAVAINLVPFILWFFEDYSSETTIIIYFFECVAGIIFAAIFVLILAPSKDPGDPVSARGKGGLLKDFLATAAVMLSACVIFL